MGQQFLRKKGEALKNMKGKEEREKPGDLQMS